MMPIVTNLVFAAVLAMPLSAPGAGPQLIPEPASASHPGYLGVGLRDVTDDRVAALKLKDTRGVEVVALDHDGPAAKIGIREHDVILQMNGQEVASAEQLRRMMRETPAGRKADLVLSRDGQDVKVEVVLGDRAASEHASLNELPELNLQLHDIANGFPVNLPEMDIELGDMPFNFGPAYSSGTGAQVESLGPQLARYFGAKDGVGILVKEVRPDSPASKAGLKAGDVIVRASGQPVSGRVEWERILRDKQGSSVSVEVLREKREQRLTLAVARKQQSMVTPDLSGLQEQLKSMQASIKDPQQEQKMRESLQQAMKDFQANRGEMEKAIVEAKRQIDSPEFKQKIAEADAEAAKTAAEVENSAEFQREVQQAQAEARKATEEWQSPEFQQQMREAQEEAQKTVEELRLQMTPMD